VICWSPIHNIVAVSVAGILTLTSAIWQTIIVNIPAVWCNLRFAMLWKTACRTDRHPGIYGGTTESLSLGLRFRTGLRQRGKKTESSIQTKYLDDALADFSGYIVADV